MARYLVWILALALVGATAVWLVVSGDDDDGTEVTVAVRQFEEVVRADLTEVTAFDGTLGFDEGNPISSGLSGTLTSAAAEGQVVREGEILFVVDDGPVVLLHGDTTIWRDLGLLPSIEPLTVRAAGTVTWTAAEDAVIEQGDVLMRIDDRPVIVLYGDVPAYRPMEEDTTGADVEQLERALVDLGFDPDGNMAVDTDFTSYTEGIVTDWQENVGAEDDGTVDLGEVVFVSGPFTIDAFDVGVGSQFAGGPVAGIFYETEPTEGDDVLALQAALIRLGYDAGGAMDADGVFGVPTRAAVRAWQEDSGMEADGVVSPGEVVFLPQAVRISSRLAEPGAKLTAGMGVLATSTDESVVTVDLPATDQAVLEEGDLVVIVLPDDSEIGGTVQFKAETATLSAQGAATFEVVIVLDDPSAAAGLDQAPVDVEVVTDRADGVMAVPVTALLALAEGGYAVEMQNADGSTRLVAVDPGMYADGLVEITSDALEPGDLVVAP